MAPPWGEDTMAQSTGKVRPPRTGRRAEYPPLSWRTGAFRPVQRCFPSQPTVLKLGAPAMLYAWARKGRAVQPGQTL
jgi:hypothetical protein